MKKFLAMILAAMMVVMTGAAFAEWDPMAGADPAESTVEEVAMAEEPVAAEKSQIEAAEVAIPDGYRIYLNDPCIASEYGSIIVLSTEYVEVAQAMDAAEDSAKLAASNGNLMLQIRLVYRPFTEGQNIETAFSCKLFADAEYPTRMMLECDTNALSARNAIHTNPDCQNISKNSYLVNVANTQETLAIKNKKTNMGYDDPCYYLYDYIAEVPASLASSNTPVYLQLNVNGSEFCYQVQ